MTNNDATDEIKKRAERYWYEDGIWEIGLGLCCLLLGGYNFLVLWLPTTPLSSTILMLLQAGVVVLIFLTINRLIGFLKNRITYPRTGYVAYRRPAASARIRRGVLIGLIAVTLAVGLTLLSLHSPAIARPAIIVAILMAGTILYFGYRYNLLRLYAVAALTVAMGFVISLLPLGEVLPTALFFTAFGVIILFSGLVALLVYLRRTQHLTSSDLDYEAPPIQEDAL